MSAAPQEPHDFPGCLVLLLGEKGAPGGRERPHRTHAFSVSHLKPLEGKASRQKRSKSGPYQISKQRAVEAREEVVPTCFGPVGGLRAGEQALACGGRSGSAAG